jgi:hypothetical protein
MINSQVGQPSSARTTCHSWTSTGGIGRKISPAELNDIRECSADAQGRQHWDENGNSPVSVARIALFRNSWILLNNFNYRVPQRFDQMTL